MSLPRREIAAAELLGGDDHDFVVNLYVAMLGRWPDRDGYAHYRERVRGRPDARVGALHEMAASDEARRAGDRVRVPPGTLTPAPPAQAAAAMVALRTEALSEELARLRDALAPMGGGSADLAELGGEALEARDAALRSELDALRREVRARLGSAPPPVPGEDALASLARHLADWVGELLAASEARTDARLRALEARVLALAARPPATG